MDTAITYEEIRRHAEDVLVKGGRFKAEVYVAGLRNRRYVVKDFSRKGFWERNLIGRIVIHREARAYASLAGIDGIPSVCKRLSPFALLVEFLEGTSFGSLNREQITPEIIGQFEHIVAGIHERGWVHLDLHRRENILLVHDRVYVVDLASALHPGMLPLVGRLLTRLIGIADRLSLIKMKTIFAPQSLSAEERKILSIRNRMMPSKWVIR
jgi:predicted Ser/Thr protein kinase